LSWIEAMALPPRFGYLTSILDTADIRSALDAAEEHRLHLLEGDRDNVLPGIHVREGHGHTLGQQYVVVETARGRYVVTGDCIYSSRNLMGINKDGVYAPLGTGIGSVWDQLKIFDRINQEVDGRPQPPSYLARFRSLVALPVFQRDRRFRNLQSNLKLKLALTK
jgi:hypothetical protein